MDYGLWSIDYGCWIMDVGLWIMDYGIRILMGISGFAINANEDLK